MSYPEIRQPPFTVVIGDDFVSIAIDGYETMATPEGPIVCVETESPDRVTSSPTVSIWGDVNLEDPTHRISLQDAHASLYQKVGDE